MRQFCGACGGALKQSTPLGDERERSVCGDCGHVWYENPTPTVATVAVSSDGARVLLARRALAPCKGLWGIPGGFLEIGEAAENGAMREAWEECGAKLAQNTRLLAVYTVLPARQVQLVYRSILLNEENLAPGVESLNVKMFEWDSVPWDELAFSTNNWALAHARDTLAIDVPPPQLRTKMPDGSYDQVPS